MAPLSPRLYIIGKTCSRKADQSAKPGDATVQGYCISVAISNLACSILLMLSLILGIENESLFVAAFNLRKSVQNQKLSFGFGLIYRVDSNHCSLVLRAHSPACTQSLSEGVA